MNVPITPNRSLPMVVGVKASVPNLDGTGSILNVAHLVLTRINTVNVRLVVSQPSKAF